MDDMIGPTPRDEAVRIIRHRQRLARQRRQDRIDEMVERLVTVPRQDIVDVLHRTDIRAAGIIHGRATGQAWNQIAVDLGFAKDANRNFLASAICQILGGPEVVQELLDEIERDRIMIAASQLYTWEEDAISKTIEDDGGMTKLAKMLGDELGFKVTIQMLWIAASVASVNDVIRIANQREWEKREQKRLDKEADTSIPSASP